MQFQLTRRVFLSAVGSSVLTGRALASAPAEAGVVTGSALGDEVGRRVLSDGGNAIDAVVAAALVAAVTDLPNCGIGGYGGHMSLALADGSVASIEA